MWRPRYLRKGEGKGHTKRKRHIAPSSLDEGRKAQYNMFALVSMPCGTPYIQACINCAPLLGGSRI